MKKIVILFILTNFIMKAYSLEPYQIKNVEIQELEKKPEFLKQINNALLEYIQKNNRFIFNTQIDNNDYKNIFELSKSYYESVYIFIYSAGVFAITYTLIIVVYDESNKTIVTIDFMDIKMQSEFNNVTLPKFFTDSN